MDQQAGPDSNVGTREKGYLETAEGATGCDHWWNHRAVLDSLLDVGKPCCCWNPVSSTSCMLRPLFVGWHWHLPHFVAATLPTFEVLIEHDSEGRKRSGASSIQPSLLYAGCLYSEVVWWLKMSGL